MSTQITCNNKSLDSSVEMCPRNCGLQYPVHDRENHESQCSAMFFVACPGSNQAGRQCVFRCAPDLMPDHTQTCELCVVTCELGCGSRINITQRDAHSCIETLRQQNNQLKQNNAKQSQQISQYQKSILNLSSGAESDGEIHSYLIIVFILSLITLQRPTKLWRLCNKNNQLLLRNW